MFIYLYTYKHCVESTFLLKKTQTTNPKYLFRGLFYLFNTEDVKKYLKFPLTGWVVGFGVFFP